MEARAHLKYVRISPRKIKIILDLIRGKDTNTAMAILKNTNKIASEHLIKLLKSAVANAEHNFNMDAGNLYAEASAQRSSLKSTLQRHRLTSCVGK